MAEPNPKRTEMDNSNVQSSSTSPKDPKSQPRLINTGTQFFKDIVNMPSFVDHTHFIEHFLKDDDPRLAIFAPRRFGKSTHLDMVQQFLQIDIDKRTGEISSSVNGPAKNKKNYELFKETRIITDGNKDLVEDHLGKHPVIYLDLKDAGISSVEEAQMHCRAAVHEAYLNHAYLKTSTRLDPDDEKANADAQNNCRNWCHPKKYKQQDLYTSLRNLVRYLYNHCNMTKVFILVDEFDALNTGALRNITEERSNNRVAILLSICHVLKVLLIIVVNVKFCPIVAGVLFTGLSYVSGLGYSEEAFNNFTILRFLDGTSVSGDSDFVPFYGATTEEVESLIQNLVKKNQLLNFTEKEEFLNDTNELDVKKIMNDVKSRYSGYFDEKGHRIFCLWSVLQYLEKGDPINYWNQTDGISDLYYILQCKKVACEIMKLIRGEIIQFRRINPLSARNLVRLHAMFSMGNEDEVDSDVVFNFLLDQGYLTYPEGGPRFGYQRGARFEEYKLPNGEIQVVLLEMIGTIVRQHWKIDTTPCSSLIADITSSLMNDEKALQIKMSNIYEAISLCLRPLEKVRSTCLNEASISCVMYGIFSGLKEFDLCADLAIKDAEGKPITSGRPDLLVLHTNENEKECTILWELKCNINKKDEYTSLYALQEARAIVQTIDGRTKNYMTSLEKIGKKLEKILVIGLSVDIGVKVSLSYAVGMEQKIFFKSEKEPTDFPSLYRTYNTVPLP